MAASSGSSSPLRQRRAERLRREIALLEHMDGRLWRRAVIDTLVAVGLIALLLIAVAAKLHYFMYHPLAVTAACLGLAGLAWWLGRYTLWIPVILVALLLAILFEDVGGLDFNGGDSGKAKGKLDRRRKLDAALAKRRRTLAKLEGRS
ncbi:hypothetical protein [Bosea beijingensis]|uniref:hypothetical protein n=1 Tax=Bosea beijingensis TaxID=3068632 RepID=UPI0027406CE3|nr:hypothetical protein [Bosea sp. REN20]